MRALNANVYYHLAFISGFTSSLVYFENFYARIGLLKDGEWNSGATVASSGLVAAVASNPFDVIKSRYPFVIFKLFRMMNESSKEAGLVRCCIKIIKEEGLHAYYRGILPHYLKSTV